MVAGLLGNKSPDSNRFTLVTPKPENGVRLQATLGNQNPTGLPVGAVSFPEELDKIYERLYEYTQFDSEKKKKIVEKIIERHGGK